eukprot:9471390-Pyramimonas_sp.AAC.1
MARDRQKPEQHLYDNEPDGTARCQTLERPEGKGGRRTTDEHVLKARITVPCNVCSLVIGTPRARTLQLRAERRKTVFRTLALIQPKNLIGQKREAPL